jgi:hypothetical protein
VPNKSGVQPEEDLVRLYLNDVGRYALLTKTDEIELAQTVEAGRDAVAPTRVASPGPPWG